LAHVEPVTALVVQEEPPAQLVGELCLGRSLPTALILRLHALEKAEVEQTFEWMERQRVVLAFHEEVRHSQYASPTCFAVEAEPCILDAWVVEFGDVVPRFGAHVGDGGSAHAFPGQS